MNTFPKIELKPLLERSQNGNVCISIFIPTFTTGSEVMQNPIRLRKMVTSIQEQLISRGMRPSEATKLLSPVRDLISDDFFFRNLSDGLAIFLSQDLFRYYRLPYKFRELMIIGDRFAVKPLLPVLSNNGKFYILALSQKQTRLLQCTHHSYRNLELPDAMPGNLDDFIKYDSRSRELQYHYRIKSSSSEGAMVARGTNTEEDVKSNLLHYFRKINQVLNQDILHDEDAPLLIAGVEYMLPIYQKANTYNHFINSIIPGNPEGVSSETLLSNAWKIIEPHFTQMRTQAQERYIKLVGTGLTSDEIEKIAIEAYKGKVELLFVGDDTEVWGKLNPEKKSVEVHDIMQPGDEDLLNTTVAYTIAHRGTVYTGGPEKTACSLPAFALLRYPV